MSLALEGVLIIDLTQYQQGPIATQMMSDMGTAVIKIKQGGFIRPDEVKKFQEK